MQYQTIARNKTSMLALTTLEPDEFTALVPAFEHCFLETMRDSTIDGCPRANRRYTSYKNSPLPTIEDKLLFILVHIKQNLTQEVQGHLFGMQQSVANKWLQLLRPILHRALQRLEVCPLRMATLTGDDDAGAHPDDATKHPDTAPLFIMMAPNALCSDRSMPMNKTNITAERRNATPSRTFS